MVYQQIDYTDKIDLSFFKKNKILVTKNIKKNVKVWDILKKIWVNKKWTRKTDLSDVGINHDQFLYWKE